VTTGERVSILEHLDELDRLLRDVQAGLVPEAAIPDPPPPPPIPDPAPPPPVPDPPPPPPIPEPPALGSSRSQPEALTAMTARLLAAMRELLDGYERVLVGEVPPRPAARRRGDSPVISVSAAPFPDVEAVHRFEVALGRLPGVREVAVRGYEGSDRAVLEVRIDPPSP
jgi:hypothetical protein